MHRVSSVSVGPRAKIGPYGYTICYILLFLPRGSHGYTISHTRLFLPRGNPVYYASVSNRRASDRLLPRWKSFNIEIETNWSKDGANIYQQSI